MIFDELMSFCLKYLDKLSKPKHNMSCVKNPDEEGGKGDACLDQKRSSYIGRINHRGI